MDINGVDMDDGAVASGGWQRHHKPSMMSVHNITTPFMNLPPNGMSDFQPPLFEAAPLPSSAFPSASSLPLTVMGSPPPAIALRSLLPLPQQHIMPMQFFAPSHWTPQAFKATRRHSPLEETPQQPTVQAAVIPPKELSEPVVPVVPAVVISLEEPSEPLNDLVMEESPQPVVEHSQPVLSSAVVEEPTPPVEVEQPSAATPAEASTPPSPAKAPELPDENAVPTDVHEILVRAKETRLTTTKQHARKLHESRATGVRPLDVALAEARIISENVYVQRKRRKWEADEVPICSCQPPEEIDQSGCQEDCVNRAALIECLDGFCPCGDRCDNQRIQRGGMPVAEVIDAGSKGLGIRTRQFIKQGDFVGEYMGEIVTEQEYHLRRLRYHNEKHRYMMVLSGGEVIDATRMGGLARFINHSCEPNCGVEKWEVNGEERCAIFALHNISAGEELSFDYKFQSFSELEITACLCGASNCRGIIGANNRATKQPRKSHASHTTLSGDQNRSFDPITKKAMSSRKTLELALERMYRALAGHRLFTRKEITMMLESRLLLKRNLMRHLDDNFRFLCLEPYFTTESDGEFGDMPPVLCVRDLPEFPPRREAVAKPARQARLEVVLERLRTQL